MRHEPNGANPVWLVGAGPGDPELLTRKAERLIYTADIVFYDALVGPDILSLIAPKAERVAVGKRSGRHSKDQESINALLLAAALIDRHHVCARAQQQPDSKPSGPAAHASTRRRHHPPTHTHAP